jgi:hypothetical protein
LHFGYQPTQIGFRDGNTLNVKVDNLYDKSKTQERFENVKSKASSSGWVNIYWFPDKQRVEAWRGKKRQDFRVINDYDVVLEKALAWQRGEDISDFLEERKEFPRKQKEK